MRWFSGYNTENLIVDQSGIQKLYIEEGNGKKWQ